MKNDTRVQGGIRPFLVLLEVQSESMFLGSLGGLHLLHTGECICLESDTLGLLVQSRYGTLDSDSKSVTDSDYSVTAAWKCRCTQDE